jgi:hypothetical protein
VYETEADLKKVIEYFKNIDNFDSKVPENYEGKKNTIEGFVIDLRGGVADLFFKVKSSAFRYEIAPELV